MGVLSLTLVLLIIAIDGLLAFEEDHEQEVKDLMSLLRKKLSVQNKVLKVLITTDRVIGSIIEDLEVDEMEILTVRFWEIRGMFPSFQPVTWVANSTKQFPHVIVRPYMKSRKLLFWDLRAFLKDSFVSPFATRLPSGS